MVINDLVVTLLAVGGGKRMQVNTGVVHIPAAGRDPCGPKAGGSQFKRLQVSDKNVVPRSVGPSARSAGSGSEDGLRLLRTPNRR